METNSIFGNDFLDEMTVQLKKEQNVKRQQAEEIKKKEMQKKLQNRKNTPKKKKSNDDLIIKLPVEIAYYSEEFELAPSDFSDAEEITIKSLKKYLINCYRGLTEKNIVVDYVEKEHYILIHMRLGSKGSKQIKIDDNENLLSALSKLPKGRHIITYRQAIYDLTNNGLAFYGKKSDGSDFFHYKLPKIPLSILKAFIEYSVDYTLKELECGAVIYMNDKQEYQLNIPLQERSSCHVNLYYESNMEKKYTHIMDLHSHHHYPFSFSTQDDRDDIAPYLYGVVYDLGQRIDFRMGNPGTYGHINIEDWNMIFYTDHKGRNTND